MRTRLFFALILIIASFFLFFFRLPTSFNFNTDFARDLYDIAKIGFGKPMLIGPKLTFGGLYSGPYYYYFFAPILLISHFNPISVLYLNAFFFAVCIGFIFWTLSTKFSLGRSFFATIVFTFLPFIISSARNPGNGYSYIPLLTIVILWPFFYKLDKVWKVLLYGFISGVILNFHPITAVIILPLCLYLLINKSSKWRTFSLFGGLLLSFTPVILFELKHNFVILSNLLFTSSVGQTVNTFQFMSHYWLPIHLAIGLLGIILICKQRQSIFISLVIIFFLIYTFPTNQYKSATRVFLTYKNAVQKVIDKQLINKKIPFNLIQITGRPNKVPVGHEYRFYLLINGYDPLPATNYTDAKMLLVFSELVDFRPQDLRSYNSWETTQFSTKPLMENSIIRSGPITIYEILK